MKNLIIKTSTKFDISKSNVLGAVVDNAFNMTKAIQLLNEDKDYSKEELDDSGTFQEATMNDTVPRDAIVNSFDVTVHHMRCAEHTLQLEIMDALKLDSFGRFLTKIRNIAGRLRAPRTDAVLKHHNKSMIIDVATRWDSTYAMLKRLFELRSTIEHEDLSDREINLSTNDWCKIQELINVLAIPPNITLQLQRENFTTGECFFAMHEAIFELRKKCGYSTYYC